jgi:hypothetical protein
MKSTSQDIEKRKSAKPSQSIFLEANRRRSVHGDVAKGGLDLGLTRNPVNLLRRGLHGVLSACYCVLWHAAGLMVPRDSCG